MNDGWLKRKREAHLDRVLSRPARDVWQGLDELGRDWILDNAHHRMVADDPSVALVTGERQALMCVPGRHWGLVGAPIWIFLSIVSIRDGEWVWLWSFVLVLHVAWTLLSLRTPTRKIARENLERAEAGGLHSPRLGLLDIRGFRAWQRHVRETTANPIPRRNVPETVDEVGA